MDARTTLHILLVAVWTTCPFTITVLAPCDINKNEGIGGRPTLLLIFVLLTGCTDWPAHPGLVLSLVAHGSGKDCKEGGNYDFANDINSDQTASYTASCRLLPDGATAGRLMGPLPAVGLGFTALVACVTEDRSRLPQ